MNRFCFVTSNAGVCSGTALIGVRSWDCKTNQNIYDVLVFLDEKGAKST